MVNEMTQSNLNILTNTVIDDSEGAALLPSQQNVSHQSGTMATDINPYLSTVVENLQGFLSDRLSPLSIQEDNSGGSSEETASFNDDLMTRDNGSNILITGVTTIQTETPLIFSDQETGVLENGDQIYQGRYSDHFSLAGLGDHQSVTLELEASEFFSSLQLINAGTQEVIDQYQIMETDGIFKGQLIFTSDNDIEYLVRVTSTGEITSGSYSLGITLGELNPQLIFSDQETGVLENGDNLYQGRYSDDFMLTGLEDNQRVTLELEASDFFGSLQLINGGTGEMINQYQITETDGTSPVQLIFTSDNDIEYLVRVTSTGEITSGSYSLGTTLGELNPKLIFSDRETGVLKSGDSIYQGRYSDQYFLTGLGGNQKVTLELEASEFFGSLQLINAATGQIINQYQITETEGTSPVQLIFTSDNDIEYLVRVTSTGEITSGSYSLGTTLGELTPKLILSDTEKGVLQSGDQTHQGRYTDEYVLRGIGDNQTVTLDLAALGFSSSLQLVNAKTGKVIDHYEVSETDPGLHGQLIFTSNSNIQYIVRVTSTGNTTTGSYTLGTTLGELTLGISDQTITGSLSNTDTVSQRWNNRYSDQYYITNLSPFQKINIKFDSSNFYTQLIVFDVDTGANLYFSRGIDADRNGVSSSELSFFANPNTNYGVFLSSYNMYQTGQYSLTVDTTASVSGGFDVGDDSVHPIIRNRLMDNYKLSSVKVGEDVKLTLNSNSSGNIIQFFNQNTGDILLTTTNKNLNFTVQEGINYGVRVLGEDNQLYSLTTTSGFLIDSTVVQVGQTIRDSFDVEDTLNIMRQTNSIPTYYMDGYYLNNNSLTVGQEIKVSMESRDFDPHVYIMNANTGEIIQQRASSSFKSFLKFTVEEGVDYLVIASSRIYYQVGDYTINIAV